MSLRELFPRCERLQADAEKLLTANLRLTEAVNPLLRGTIVNLRNMLDALHHATQCEYSLNWSTELLRKAPDALAFQKARMDAEFMRAAFMKEQTECNSKVVDALREKLLEAEKATHP